MSTRITYKCKKCGWTKSICGDWEDIKPKKCGGKKCKVIFLLNPEQLEIIKEKEKKD